MDIKSTPPVSLKDLQFLEADSYDRREMLRELVTNRDNAMRTAAHFRKKQLRAHSINQSIQLKLLVRIFPTKGKIAQMKTAAAYALASAEKNGRKAQSAEQTVMKYDTVINRWRAYMNKFFPRGLGRGEQMPAFFVESQKKPGDLFFVVHGSGEYWLFPLRHIPDDRSFVLTTDIVTSKEYNSNNSCVALADGMSDCCGQLLNTWRGRFHVDAPGKLWQIVGVGLDSHTRIPFFVLADEKNPKSDYDTIGVEEFLRKRYKISAPDGVQE